MSLKTVFSSLSDEDLKWACSLDWLLLKKAFENKKVQSISSVILSFYRNSILEGERFRYLLIKTLPAQVVDDLAKKYTHQVSLDAKTNIRNLANLPWSLKSPLVDVFRKYLKIEGDYLPSLPIKNSAIEELNTFSVLPPLFEYQKEVIEKALKIINNPTASNFVIQLPTGSGKTRVMMEVLTKHKENNNLSGREDKSIIWLAHSTELLEQAVDTLKNVWGNKGSGQSKLIRLYQSFNIKGVSFNNSFIFASLQKISSAQKNNKDLLNKLINEIDIIVIDEAHKVIAPTYKSAIKALSTNKTRIIGITATPGRSIDNEEQNNELAAIFNYNLIQPQLGNDPIKTLRDMGVLSIVQHKEIETGLEFSMRESNSSDFSTQSLKQLSESTARNEKISDIVKDEVNRKNPTIIFSCSKEHSRILCAFLAVKGVRGAYVDHRQSYSARKKIIDNFREGIIDVIVNFGILSTGFDAPRIKTVIISRPTTSLVLYSQMLGRGLRGPQVGGNKYCSVIDIVDNFKNFGNQEKVYNFFSDFWGIK